jgi:hypothetical protein
MKILMIEDHFFKGGEIVIQIKRGLHEDIGTKREGLFELLIYAIINVIQNIDRL